MKRRKFIKNASLTGVGLAIGNTMLGCDENTSTNSEISESASAISDLKGLPLVIATWNVPNATKKAMEVLQEGGNSLDAVEPVSYTHLTLPTTPYV